jgi:hypothetical protein
MNIGLSRMVATLHTLKGAAQDQAVVEAVDGLQEGISQLSQGLVDLCTFLDGLPS